jgi:FAD dependent oxidoreductase TIGR03364
MGRHDLIVVGAGIVGLAHALAAARRGWRVLVIDRDAQANGASIRNFGYVTVSGQDRGAVWTLARRTAAVWREVAAPAGIAIEQAGATLVAQTEEGAQVLTAFAATEMGEGCTLLDPRATEARLPMLRPGTAVAGMASRDDLRVDSREAIPRLAAWLERVHGVVFRRDSGVRAVERGVVIGAGGARFAADRIIVCPGDDLTTLFPERIAAYGTGRCLLQMLRLSPPGWRLPTPVMADLSLARYGGFADLPEATALKARMMRERGAALAQGIHLIVVQDADGALVVGDSHHYARTPPPFAPAEVERLILAEYTRLFGVPPSVRERWTGTYAVADRHHFVDTPAPGVRLVVVTSGSGASTAFALAEQVVAQMEQEGETGA